MLLLKFGKYDVANARQKLRAWEWTRQLIQARLVDFSKNRHESVWCILERIVALRPGPAPRARAAKVQPKNVWAEAEPNFSWAEAGKCLSQPSRAGKIPSRGENTRVNRLSGSGLVALMG